MFDYIPFETIQGSKNERELKLIALSTCAFCKKAMAFLKDHNWEFQYVFVDKIDAELKQKAKEDFKKVFDSRLSFPTLLIDNQDFLSGFIKVAWEDAL